MECAGHLGPRRRGGRGDRGRPAGRAGHRSPGGAALAALSEGSVNLVDEDARKDQTRAGPRGRILTWPRVRVEGGGRGVCGRDPKA